MSLPTFVNYTLLIIHLPESPPSRVNTPSFLNWLIIFLTCRTLIFSCLDSSSLDIEGFAFIRAISCSGTLWHTSGTSWHDFSFICSPNNNSKIFFLIKFRCFQAILTTFVNDIFCPCPHLFNITIPIHWVGRYAYSLFYLE